MDYTSIIANFKRRADIAQIIPPGGIGVELGVAEGGFSERLLKHSPLAYLYSIDMWAGDRGHDIEQHRAAFRKLDPFRSRSTILKMRFDEALCLFPDGYFDFIYIDGYAHTGEENGQTFRDWYPKLKSGGIFAGDDYSPAWPLVVAEVDKFVAAQDLKLYVIPCEPEEDWASKYPTWFVHKP
jgi:hypothetical protein